MTDWKPAAVLPNIELRNSIQTDYVALIGHDDERLQSILKRRPNFRKFLGRFTDAFGEKHRPAILLLRSDAPSSIVNSSALAGFRDAISLACITQSRAREIMANRPMGIKYANAFSLYPWMMDKNDRYLVVQTFSQLGLHDVNKFKGQSDPHIAVGVLSETDYDQPLLQELLNRWENRYLARRPSWESIALFRSLNMAFHASQLPGGSDAVFHDVGRIIAIWVSAFEILAHPGPGGRSNLAAVYDLLEKAKYIYRESTYKRYLAYESGRPQRRRILSARLYGELFQTRNHFLHGNEVSVKSLRVKGRHKAGLFLLASALYRVALTTFLKLDFVPSYPPNPDADAIAAATIQLGEFRSPQRNIEKAILKSRRIDPSPRGRPRPLPLS